jgi:hypothetical protein
MSEHDLLELLKAADGVLRQFLTSGGQLIAQLNANIFVVSDI